MIDPSVYGPFGPVVGYGAATIAAVSAISFTWQGRLEKWKPPEEDLPKVAQKIVLMLCGIGMVAVWYFAEPNTSAILLFAGISMGLLCFATFLIYTGIIGKYSFVRKVPVGKKGTREAKILGGDILFPEAVKAMKMQKLVSIQDLFELKDCDPDKLWSRESRQRVKTRVVALYVVMLFSGTLALTMMGFVTQVALTGRPVAEIIRTFDEPIRQEITDFIARLNRELQRFEDTIRKRADLDGSSVTALNANSALLSNIKQAQNEIDRFRSGRRFNASENNALSNAFEQLEKKKHVLEDESLSISMKYILQQDQTDESLIPPLKVDSSDGFEVHGSIKVRLEGVPENLVVFYNELSDGRKSELLNKLNGMGTVLVKGPIIPNGGRIVYSEAEGDDMIQCAELVQVLLDQFEPGLGKALPITEIKQDRLTQALNMKEARRTVWVYLP